MEKKSFTFRIKDEENVFTTEIIFTGELKGRSPFIEEDFQKLQRRIRKDAESKFVIMNLTEVTFWDTEGMRQTLKLAEEINQKIGQNRVYIVAPKEGYLISRAKEKYVDLIDKTVPWKEKADT